MNRAKTDGGRDDGQFAEDVSQQHPAGGEGGSRREVGNAASSREHPPHVTEGADDAPVQDSGGAAEIPTLPANAAGTDRVSTDEQTVEIDEASMYDGRPEEDKDRAPSERGTP